MMPFKAKLDAYCERGGIPFKGWVIRDILLSLEMCATHDEKAGLTNSSPRTMTRSFALVCVDFYGLCAPAVMEHAGVRTAGGFAAALREMDKEGLLILEREDEAAEIAALPLQEYVQEFCGNLIRGETATL